MKNYLCLCWFFVTSSKESSSLKKRSHQTSPRILKRSRFNSISDLTTVILIQGMFTLCMIWIKSIQYSGIIFLSQREKRILLLRNYVCKFKTTLNNLFFQKRICSLNSAAINNLPMFTARLWISDQIKPKLYHNNLGLIHSTVVSRKLKVMRIRWWEICNSTSKDKNVTVEMTELSNRSLVPIP